MNVTKVLVRLGNVVEMPFAPTLRVAFHALANLVTLVILMSTVMTLMSVEMIARFVEEKQNVEMFLDLLNAHVSTERPLTPLQKDVGVQWHALLIISVLVMQFVLVALVLVLNPTLDQIVKTLVIQPLVFPMLSVLFKLAFLCADVCLVSNYYLFRELVLILTSVRQKPPHVDQEHFVKILLAHLDVNVLLEPLETQPKVAKAPLLKNADQTPNVELEKPVSLAKENVFAEEVMIETLKQEDVKISMNVWPVPNLFVVLMLYVKIFQEAMNANVHQDFLEIHLVDVKNAQEDLVHVSHPIY
jgi:hypothetical protein